MRCLRGVVKCYRAGSDVWNGQAGACLYGCTGNPVIDDVELDDMSGTCDGGSGGVGVSATKCINLIARRVVMKQWRGGAESVSAGSSPSRPNCSLST
jgi:hypothetical protein